MVDSGFLAQWQLKVSRVHCIPGSTHVQLEPKCVLSKSGPESNHTLIGPKQTKVHLIWLLSVSRQGYTITRNPTLYKAYS